MGRMDIFEMLIKTPLFSIGIVTKFAFEIFWKPTYPHVSLEWRSLLILCTTLVTFVFLLLNNFCWIWSNTRSDHWCQSTKLGIYCCCCCVFEFCGKIWENSTWSLPRLGNCSTIFCQCWTDWIATIIDMIDQIKHASKGFTAVLAHMGIQWLLRSSIFIYH